MEDMPQLGTLRKQPAPCDIYLKATIYMVMHINYTANYKID